MLMARPKPISRMMSVALALVLSLGGVILILSQSAQAAARVTATNLAFPDKGAVADSTYLTEMQVSGSGFQSIQNGFGGIYVVFGWVAGGDWQPSKGGMTGQHYQYVYDNESNPVGYQLFVTFPGSSTSYAANGGSIKADGTWSATITIPGPKFPAYDRQGNQTMIDCLQVQCGIITFGAHGVKNAANETFTPVSFADLYAASESGSSNASAPKLPQVPGTTDSLGIAESAGGPVAVAPESIGGRPAVVPAAVSAGDLNSELSGDMTAVSGATRVTVTLPQADTESWYGLTVLPGDTFLGWYKPNSQGQFDLNMPENIAAGDLTVLAQDDQSAVQGWAAFTWTGFQENVEAAAPVAEEETAKDEGQDPTTVESAAPEVAEQSGDSSVLRAAVIVVSVLAIVAVAILIYLTVVTRKKIANSADAQGEGK